MEGLITKNSVDKSDSIHVRGKQYTFLLSLSCIKYVTVLRVVQVNVSFYYLL